MELTIPQAMVALSASDLANYIDYVVAKQVKEKTDEAINLIRRGRETVTTSQAMDILHCSKTTLWRNIKRGHLVPLEGRAGREAVYYRADVEKLITNHLYSTK